MLAPMVIEMNNNEFVIGGGVLKSNLSQSKIPRICPSLVDTLTKTSQ